MFSRLSIAKISSFCLYVGLLMVAAGAVSAGYPALENISYMLAGAAFNLWLCLQLPIVERLKKGEGPLGKALVSQLRQLDNLHFYAGEDLSVRSDQTITHADGREYVVTVRRLKANAE